MDERNDRKALIEPPSIYNLQWLSALTYEERTGLVTMDHPSNFGNYFERMFSPWREYLAPGLPEAIKEHFTFGLYTNALPILPKASMGEWMPDVSPKVNVEAGLQRDLLAWLRPLRAYCAAALVKPAVQWALYDYRNRYGCRFVVFTYYYGEDESPVTTVHAFLM